MLEALLPRVARVGDVFDGGVTVAVDAPDSKQTPVEIQASAEVWTITAILGCCMRAIVVLCLFVTLHYLTLRASPCLQPNGLALSDEAAQTVTVPDTTPVPVRVRHCENPIHLL